jgi:hypothetical protein
MCASRSSVVLWLAVALLSAAPGCRKAVSNGSDQQGRLRELKAVDPDALEQATRAFLDSMFTRIVAAAGDASAGGAPREVREAALRLRIRTAEIVQALREPQDARSMFVHTWLAVAGLRQQLSDGEMARLFGDRAKPLLQTIQALESEIVQIGCLYFPPELIEQSRDDVDRAAALTGQTLGRGANSAVAAEPDLMTVLRIPLLPVSTLRGVSSTPEAIDRFSQSVLVVGQTIKDMPQRLRWEAELLQWEIAEDGPVPQLLAELNTANQTLSEAIRVARDTPDKVADRVDQSLQRVSSDLPAWNEFIGNVRGGTEQLRQAVQDLSPVLEALKAVVAEARLVVQEVKSMQPERGRDPQQPGTDFNKLADSTRDAATELRALIRDLRDDNANRQAVMAFESAGQRLLRAAFIYAGLLLVLAVFALFLLKRAARPPAED